MKKRRMKRKTMNPFELQRTLDTMEIIIDSREHPTAEAAKRWKSFGCPYVIEALKSGDYSARFTLPNGEIFDMRDKVVFERKMDLTEICGNFCQNRERFVREFERMKETGAKCYILIDNGSWEKAFAGQYRSRMQPKSLVASLTAWVARYNAQIIFCRPETTGKLIKEILYREAKEILQNYCI